MKTSDYIKRFDPCDEGTAFALKFETMQEVWEACKRPDWLVFMATNAGPNQAIRIMIRSCLKDIIDNYFQKIVVPRDAFVYGYDREPRYNYLSPEEKINLCNLIRDSFPCPFDATQPSPL